MPCEDQITPQNLTDAKTDAITLGEVSTSRAGAESGGAPITQSTNRFGETTDTIQGRLNKLGVIFDDPIKDWSASLLVSDLRAHRYPAITGDIYIPVKPLPFTTGATFNTDDWGLLQGLNSQDLINDISNPIVFETTSDAINFANELPLKKAVSIKGSGGDTWDVVLTSTITIGVDAIQSVSFPLKSFARRDVSIRFETLNGLIASSYDQVKADVAHFDTDNKPGSGGVWVRDGTTGAASTTDFINGKIFNANGDGYTIESQDGKLAPVQLGAIGDDTTDDTTSLNNFFSFAASAGLDVDGLNYIHFTQAVSATYNGIINRLKLRAASVQEYLIRIDVSESLKTYDCDFNCDNVAAKGLFVRNESAIVNPIFVAVNSKARNFAQAPSTGQAAGIQVQGRFRKAVVIGCDIENGSSTHGSPIIRGITFEPDGGNGQSPQLAVVDGGSITNVMATNDADGVNFTLPFGGDLERYRMKIKGVDFLNCTKRSVKSQVRNNTVIGNNFTFSGTPIGSRFAEVEFQMGGGVCTGNKFYTDSSQTTGFRFVQISDDDTLIANNASVISGNNIISRQGDEFLFAIITDDASQPARTLKGIRITGNTYSGTCQYAVQLNPVAHGGGTSTTIIDNLTIANNYFGAVTGALLWQGRRTGPSVSSRVRLSVHDNMMGTADTTDVPTLFENQTNLSIIYIKNSDNENFTP